MSMVPAPNRTGDESLDSTGVYLSPLQGDVTPAALAELSRAVRAVTHGRTRIVLFAVFFACSVVALAVVLLVVVKLGTRLTVPYVGFIILILGAASGPASTLRVFEKRFARTSPEALALRALLTAYESARHGLVPLRKELEANGLETEAITQLIEHRRRALLKAYLTGIVEVTQRDGSRRSAALVQRITETTPGRSIRPG
jgi:hypothetical protein